MLELLIFLLALGADMLVKYWSMASLAAIGEISLIPGIFHLRYLENWAQEHEVSFIRGRSPIMTAVRLAQVLLIVYLIFFQRKKLAPITRVALMLFLAGLIGNQINYFTMDFVPDMFELVALLPGIVFNLADVFVVVGMVILFFRLAFYEGQTFITWVFSRTSKKNETAGKKEQENLVDE